MNFLSQKWQIRCKFFANISQKMSENVRKCPVFRTQKHPNFALKMGCFLASNYLIIKVLFLCEDTQI